ncbi:MAG: class I SAM-dependent methyltransferase [Myxococcales bacterium]|nr:class I SAM-dependent methyltransferase [Myxococcales bacterium]
MSGGAARDPADPDEADRQRALYAEGAERYDALVSAEDADRALDAALAELLPVSGARALDVGCGTGRMARVLFGLGAAHVTGIDRAPAMLAVARRRLAREVAAGKLLLLEADARELALAPGSFDCAVAGWCFGHFRHWMPDDWRSEVGRALDAVERALVPGGHLVVVETLGTGHETPRSHAALDEYFAWLEQERGLARRTLRTDYAFASLAQALEVLGAFFPAELVLRVRARGAARVPECTGLWWRRVG